MLLTDSRWEKMWGKSLPPSGRVVSYYLGKMVAKLNLWGKKNEHIQNFTHKNAHKCKSITFAETVAFFQ